jgi:pimeloyl-ACP methyl ester carboxylesterase
VLVHPERVASLILMDTSGEAITAIPTEFLDSTVARARADGMKAVAESFSQLADNAFTGPPESKARILERMRAKLSNMDVEAFDALGHGLRDFPPMIERLAETVHVPITVIVGEHDAGLLPAAHKLHDGLPGSTLVVIPDAAHSPQEENPRAWLEAVRAHLERAEHA